MYKKFNEEVRQEFLKMLPLYLDRSSGDKIRLKEDKTPVSNLDLYARDVLARIIKKHFPNVTIIAEEDRNSPEAMSRFLADQNQIYATIDGLDGTGNRAMELYSFGAMLSFRKGNEILLAIIFIPSREKIHSDGFFYAENSKGVYVWRGEQSAFEKLSAARPKELKRIMIMPEGRATKFGVPPVADVIKTFTTRPSHSSSVAAITFVLGKTSAIITKGNQPWDNWPILLFAQEATRETDGGVVKFDGTPATPDDCADILAFANPEDGGEILAVLSTSAKLLDLLERKKP